jgi:hypothetical protein
MLKRLVETLQPLILSMAVVGSRRREANDYEAAAGSKRKRALKSMSATPEMDEDDEEHDLVGAGESPV